MARVSLSPAKPVTWAPGSRQSSNMRWHTQRQPSCANRVGGVGISRCRRSDRSHQYRSDLHHAVKIGDLVYLSGQGVEILDDLSSLCQRKERSITGVFRCLKWGRSWSHGAVVVGLQPGSPALRL
ncbi:hypothetical protein L1887_47401 [Cichorium endivia]|nr:hypothetical protein L1887_47401 [Cichorium endivia]